MFCIPVSFFATSYLQHPQTSSPTFPFLCRLHSYGEGELNFKKSFVYVAFANTISQVCTEAGCPAALVCMGTLLDY
jgi:hypothetical protein